MTGEPLLVDVNTLCQLLSIHRSNFFVLKSAGRIGPVPVRLNHKQLFVRSEIEEWISARDTKTGQLPNRERWLAMQRDNQ